MCELAGPLGLHLAAFSLHVHLRPHPGSGWSPGLGSASGRMLAGSPSLKLGWVRPLSHCIKVWPEHTPASWLPSTPGSVSEEERQVFPHPVGLGRLVLLLQASERWPFLQVGPRLRRMQ